MKKRVSAELISIAHRILKLKNHSETVQLQQEAKNLYDQLTILRFYEENFEMVKNEISEEVLVEKLEGMPTEVFNAPIQEKVVETSEVVHVDVAPAVEEVVAEPIVEEKVVIAELVVEDDDEEEEEVPTMERNAENLPKKNDQKGKKRGRKPKSAEGPKLFDFGFDSNMKGVTNSNALNSDTGNAMEIEAAFKEEFEPAEYSRSRPQDSSRGASASNLREANDEIITLFCEENGVDEIIENIGIQEKIE